MVSPNPYTFLGSVTVKLFSRARFNEILVDAGVCMGVRSVADKCDFTSM